LNGIDPSPEFLSVLVDEIQALSHSLLINMNFVI